MKRIITLLLLATSQTIFAQDASFKTSKFSIGVETGKVVSFFNLPSNYGYDIICCFGDCTFLSDEDNGELNRPMSVALPQATLFVSYQIGKRHQIGLGYQRTQYGETQKIEEQMMNRVLKFHGISARHRYSLLHGNRIGLDVANTISFELPRKNGYNIDLGRSISHTAGLICSYKLLRHFDIEASIVGRTAISKYYDGAFSGVNNRFGYGAMFGLTYKI